MRKTVLLVVIFAVAFAFVEAAVVVYLRHLLGTDFSPVQVDSNLALLSTPAITFLKPNTAIDILQDSSILGVEQFREFATLIMLGAVAFIAGKDRLQKLAYFFLAFGVWDIFYYVFLALTIGWPQSLFDTDIFFLLPVPWIGPVITPLVISSLLVAGSIFVIRTNETECRNDEIK